MHPPPGPSQARPAPSPQPGPPRHRAPPPRPQPTRGRGPAILFALLGGIALGGSCATCASLSAGGSDRIFYGKGENVGVVELVGEITDGGDVVEQIRKFAKRDDLVALVIRIDSPGGAVAPSQEIYQAMRNAAKTKPVVASMGNVAASGGFWASLGADWVFASPGTITGSIGVITQSPDLQGLAEIVRFKMRTFKSGPLKDAGNPLREMTPEDEALFTSLIEDIYDQFVTLTAERRNLSLDKVRIVADGRILTGRAAKTAGLIDELGGLHDAARKAQEMAMLKKAKDDGTETSSTALQELEDPTLVYPKKPRPSFLEMISEAAANGVATGVARAFSTSIEGARWTNPVELR